MTELPHRVLPYLTTCLAGFMLCVFAATQAAGQDVTLAPGDVVKLIAYGREDFSGERAIDASGRLLVPLLGRMEAAGSTPDDLGLRIGAALVDRGLLTDQAIYVDVVRWRDIFVGGNVASPGAYPWNPGLTLQQAVTLAGGRLRVPDDDIGTFIQAISAVERYRAIEVATSSLASSRARLEAEIAFVGLSFGTERALHADASSKLDVEALLPSTGDKAGGAADARQGIALLADIDSKSFSALQQDRPDLSLIVFPPSVTSFPELSEMRATEEFLLRNRLDIHLATREALTLDREALGEQIALLEEQDEILGSTIEASQSRLDTLTTLRSSGLMRAQDVQNSETSHAALLTTRLDLLAELSDTRIALQQQDAAIAGFVPRLQRELATELESVMAAELETRARLDLAARAARVAQAYLDLGPDAGGDSASPIRWEITRGRGQETQTLQADIETPVLPGDTITVSGADTF